MTESQAIYWAIAAGIILPYLSAWLIRRWRRSRDPQPLATPRPIAYVALRNQILNSRPPQADLSAPDASRDPWAVVMDWGVRCGTATVVAVADGTASIYYSTGGGAIGGVYARPSIRSAALHAIAIAGKFLDHMQLNDSFPLPETDGFAFHVVTKQGVYAAKASLDLLRTNQHPLSELNLAMQAITTEYRIIDSSPN